MEAPAYRLDQIRFSYPGLRRSFELEVSGLTIDEGEIVALVGPNGAGKTTLLMLLSFLLRPKEGRIAFFRKNPWPDAEAVTRARREAVLVTHHPYLFKGTIRDNILFGLKIRGTPEAEWALRVAESLSLVELQNRETAAVGNLSAGQIQRVALARAMALRPKVLLLDEPTANVETGLGSRIEAVIREFSRVRRTTILFSTHNYSQASRLADEVLFLSDGRRVRYSHENCFSGTAGGAGGSSWIEPKPGVIIRFPGSHSGHTTCLINPDRIELVPPETPPPAGTPNVFPGHITRLETTEADIALVRISGDLTFRATLPVRDLDDRGISLCRSILVKFDPEAVEVVRIPSGEDSHD